MGKQTPFYALHQQANAKIVDFAGWDMPLHYGSQLTEHHQVRNDAGLFDVSHMGIVDIEGAKATDFLKYLLANNVAKLIPGKALYTCMLNETGGIIDDLIVYKLQETRYRLVVNAGTRDKDIAWIKQQAEQFALSITERNDLAMLAIQGPQIHSKISQYLPPDQAQALLALKPFHFVELNGWFIARTGYTGEDGYEVIFPQTEAKKMWQMFTAVGIKPCGLGARDTLRLEAGLNLYGSDMTEEFNPFEVNLGWTVGLKPEERDFIGRKALETALREGIKHSLVGLVLQGPGVIRNHQVVKIPGNGEGEVTSGGFSPTLNMSIALARIPAQDNAKECYVEIRNKQIPAMVIKPPFVRKGKKMF